MGGSGEGSAILRANRYPLPQAEDHAEPGNIHPETLKVSRTDGGLDKLPEAASISWDTRTQNNSEALRAAAYAEESACRSHLGSCSLTLTL